MSRFLTLVAFLIFSASCAELSAKSGLPVPRFVTLRAERINVRVGPGVRYPLKWVFLKSKLPVEVTAEFDTWRKIRDVDGEEGWVHQSMLNGTRYVRITDNNTNIFKKPIEKESDTVAILWPGVIAKLLSCKGKWCRVLVKSNDGNEIKGWTKRNENLWGVYDEEEIS